MRRHYLFVMEGIDRFVAVIICKNEQDIRLFVHSFRS